MLDVASLGPERWRELERVVDALLDAAPAERPRVLAVRCAGDDALRDAALAWLRACESAGGPLDAPDDLLRPLVPPAPALLGPGMLVGPWRLDEEIGRGGMGVVFRAERADRDPPMRAAVKVMQQAAALDPHALRRFREERRILAALEHPGIARLVDGGASAGGLQWLAMELVDGAPIDRWCDARALPVEARLRLFCDVCDAVDHAHRRLVVHRDLKPSNVFVTGDGAVKLLDFGIAKLLDVAAERDDPSDAGPLTRTGLRAMTLAYAAPEQVLGAPVSTATDVYSLGVLLHLLLAARLPFAADAGDATSLERRILAGGAERPSAVVARAGPSARRLARRLAGDLDTIVARAMHLEPERRYATADALAADVRRHLAGEPVRARPDTAGYRLRKFVRRHPAGVVGAALLVGVVAAFTGVTALQAARLRDQATRLVAERDKAEQVTAVLTELIASSDPYRVGARATTLREVLDRGAARVRDGLGEQPAVRAHLLSTMASAYLGLGEWDRARSLAEDALRVRRGMHGDRHPEVVSALIHLAQVRLVSGHAAPAESLYREALAVRRRLPAPAGRAAAGGAGPGLPDSARILSGIGSALTKQGRHAEADAVLRAVLRAERARRPVDPIGVAQVARNLAHSLRDRRQWVEAEPLYREALALHRATFGDDHAETGNSYVNLAVARHGAGARAEAESLFRRGLDAKERALGASHPDVAVDRVTYAGVLAERGALAEAEALIRHAIAAHRASFPPGDLHVADDLAALAPVLLARGDASGAVRALREELAVRRAVLPADHRSIRAAAALLARARAAGAR